MCYSAIPNNRWRLPEKSIATTNEGCCSRAFPRGFTCIACFSAFLPCSVIMPVLHVRLIFGVSASCFIKVNREMSLGLQACGVDTWLGVVPQLIARVHAASPRVTKLLRELLVRIGRKHPQVQTLFGQASKAILFFVFFIGDIDRTSVTCCGPCLCEL